MPILGRIQGSLKFGPHKGYHALATYDDEAGFFHGEVIGLRDVITFQGTTPAELNTAFAESVDDYLEFCQQRGESPEKPFSGKFVTRVAPSLHKKLSQVAELRGQSLNGFVTEILRRAVRSGRSSARLSKTSVAKKSRSSKSGQVAIRMAKKKPV